MTVLQINSEPLPGYRLLEPLGKGGFGEVWKCEAPGGLLKAIKIVAGKGRRSPADPATAAQELRALQHIKSFRHPFILSLDRVELRDGDLIIVMELADRNLLDLFGEYRARRRPGVPRDELLGYLRETAEVLDLMNQQHDLQHLDIKPSNLFLVAGHVKVADFGLVASVAEWKGGESAMPLGSLSPLYAPPESFFGRVSPASDQYSLAITFHEMLTGEPPFDGKNFRQLAMQHIQSPPDLSALPTPDRPILARALSKEPKDRFPSCSAFVKALTGSSSATEMRVPAQAYFHLDGAPTAPKEPTAPDIQLGPANPTATVPVVKPEAARAPSPAPSPSPSPPAVAEFGGLRLVECLSRQPNGELWRALTRDGRKRFLRFVIDVEDARAKGDPFARLAIMKHARLAKMDIVRDGSDRVGLVMEAGDENLGVRLKECMQAGMTGVPRQELLEHLDGVAAALDELYEIHRLQHLTLSPRTVALVGGKSRLLDFGLAELFWLPSGQSPGGLNTRYAAPELFEGQLSRHVDQYSLALLFQEMLTGVHPYRNLNARQMTNPRQRGNPDVGMLPAPDRGVVLRALSLEPDRRFANCSEFVEALMNATVRPVTPAPVSSVRVPAVTNLKPIASGSPTVIAPSRRGPVVVVSSAQAINELMAVASEGREVRERNYIRFLLTPGKSIRHYCCARQIPSMIRLKLAGFREQWKATLIEKEDDRFLYHVPLTGSIWRRALGMLPSVAVEVRCEFPPDENVALTETAIEISPLECSTTRGNELLDDMGPNLLESLRTYLNALPERRSQLRLPYEQTIQVLPVFDGEPGDPIISKMQDISQRGMNVLMPCRPPSVQVNVRVTLPSRSEPATITARVMRVRPCKDGRFEIGLAFA